MLERFPQVVAWLREQSDGAAMGRLRAAETIGRPLGSPGFLADIERRTGRTLAPAKRGPKPRGAVKPGKARNSLDAPRERN